jgi:phage terminase small subunit
MLEEVEAYASGALFVLALYCTAVEAAANKHEAARDAGKTWVSQDAICDAATFCAQVARTARKAAYMYQYLRY